ncbi:MAG TPA: hypothetical protein VGK29_25545 [Paludibaculum sp.]|jgi:hypothetical protein
MTYILALILVTTSAFAQDDLAAQARHRLASPNLTEKAWGVRLAAGLRLPGFDELLIAELRANQNLRAAKMDGPEYAYIQALLDALIERETAVPAEIIEPYRSRWPTEAVILLARTKDSTPTLVAMQAEYMDDIRWLAISNILLERRAGNLFERMLDGLPATHHFFVTARAKPLGVPGGVPGGTGGITTEAPKRSFPAGFPAIALYRLTLAGDWGAVLIADGPQKVHYRRVIVPAGGTVDWPDNSRASYPTARFEYRLEYLARLTGRTLTDVRSIFQAETIIRWRDSASLARQIENRMDEQASALRRFAAEAELHGANPLRIEILPTLTDLRPAQPAPLPQPKPREVILDPHSPPAAPAAPRTNTNPPK